MAGRSLSFAGPRRVTVSGRMVMSFMVARISVIPFTAKGAPGAVLHQAHGALLVVFGLEVVEEVLHKGHDAGVIGGGRQHDLSVAEGVLQGLGHVAAGKIRHRHLGAALGAQEVRQLLRRGGGVAAGGWRRRENALALHARSCSRSGRGSDMGDGLRQDRP